MKIKYKLLIVLFICMLRVPKVQAGTSLVGIENFPISYQAYLSELTKKHPEWTFTAVYTNLEWQYVIDQESVFGKNLVPLNYSDAWKNTETDKYNVEVDSGWIDSSRQAVEYCMDPRNFLNEVRIFQFETLSYDKNTNNINGIEKILYGTEFYETQVSYLDSIGNKINMKEKYSDLILSGGKTSGVSPYHLASRIKQEVGPFLSHSSISGTVEGFEGLYNFYNIGATSSSEYLGAIKNGLQYAKDGKGASETIKNKYLIPWNTKEKAITGGAIFIGASYINVGQNTIYFQKFDIENFWHQYMTNILAPYSESKSIYNGYSKAGILDTALSFIIPVYENMPDIPVDNPNINLMNYTEDNTKVYCNATNVNIRTGPSSSYEIITTVTLPDKMTRIQKGEEWDKVILENGIVGYIYNAYLTDFETEEIDKKVTGIYLDEEEIYLEEGDTFKINAYIEPQDATNNQIIYISENEEIAAIDSDGTVTAKNWGETTIIAKASENQEISVECKIVVLSKLENLEIDFGNLIVNGFEISGLSENKVSEISKEITTNLEFEILNNKNEVLTDTQLIGTGSKLHIKENGEVLREYKFILYGDVNGDGKINSVDLLLLQRHILEFEKLLGVYVKAANVRKNDKAPNSVDLLLIQRHILGLQQLEQ